MLVHYKTISGWSGEMVHNGSSFQGMCCHGVLSMPIKGMINWVCMEMKMNVLDINLRKLRDSTTTIATTTTTTTTTTITTPPGKVYFSAAANLTLSAPGFWVLVIPRTPDSI